jgi:SAM-dependent methyltransferase
MATALDHATASDPQKLDRFAQSALADVKGTVVLTMAHLGDRLGLFKALAERPWTSVDLAEHLELNERYVREWLSGMACAEYLDYEVATGSFSIPPEHAEVLARETSPSFLGGLYQEMPALWRVLDKIQGKFAAGGGLSLQDYGPDWWHGMERFTRTWFENFLLQEWIPRSSEIQSRLQKGLHVADIGCGRGRALVKLARAFPLVSGVGYDLGEANLEGARRHAEEEGVGERITFARHDVHAGLPERYGLITSFDSLHDFADPAVALRAVHRALDNDGSFLLLEFKVADRLEDNAGPIGAMLYGWSLAYCMTTSLGSGGVGLGTCGLPQKEIRRWRKTPGSRRWRWSPSTTPSTSSISSGGSGLRPGHPPRGPPRSGGRHDVVGRPLRRLIGPGGGPVIPRPRS